MRSVLFNTGGNLEKSMSFFLPPLKSSNRFSKVVIGRVKMTSYRSLSDFNEYKEKGMVLIKYVRHVYHILVY